MTQLFFGRDELPLTIPCDVIRYLAKGEAHWKKGRSAYELAHSWFDAQDLPESVRAVLDTCPDFRGASLKKATFEVQTHLDELNRGPSQTDIIAELETAVGSVLLGVEGKVDETFDHKVSQWLDFSPNKSRRLAGLIEKLQLKSDSIGDLRYQLLHRTRAVLIEAEKIGANNAVVVVQSFSPPEKRAGYPDFEKFSTALGTPVSEPGTLSRSRMLGKIELRLGWCETPLSPREVIC